MSQKPPQKNSPTERERQFYEEIRAYHALLSWALQHVWSGQPDDARTIAGPEFVLGLQTLGLHPELSVFGKYLSLAQQAGVDNAPLGPTEIRTQLRELQWDQNFEDEDENVRLLLEEGWSA